MPIPSSLRERIEVIRENRISGAAALTGDAAEALLLAAELAPGDLKEAARLIVAAQPAMAPLVNLAYTAVTASDPRTAIHGFVERMRDSALRVAAHAARLIRDDDVVLTHSSSEAVYRTFLRARTEGKRFRVICTESRPLCEGAELARRLGREGVPVTLIADAAAASALQEVALALVGADAVCSRGVVNKTGTALIALAAKSLGVRMYALCGTEKFLPAGYDLPPELPKDPREILSEASDNVSVQNYYFEETPLDRLTGIVTEDGLKAN